MNVGMNRGLAAILSTALVSGALGAGGVAAQVAGQPGSLPPQAAEPLPPEPSVEARIWLDRGADPLVQRGDRVRVYYRTSIGAYVTIFHVDTNGTTRLVFPQTPESQYFVEGGRDFRLLFPPTSSWFVEDDPGVGYFFILASPEPMEFADFPYSWQGRDWDLSFVGQAVYQDPFVAMDEYIARLIPDWEYADYTLDWVEYNVGERHDYPRFLCYDCHGFAPYTTWNPYLSACTSFRVVIYDDPWYYPVNRYRGNAVVYVRPTVWRQPRYAFTERVAGDPWTPLVRPRPAAGGPGIPGSVAPRRTGAGIGTGGTSRVYPTRRGTVAVPGTSSRSSRPAARTRPSQVRDRRTTVGTPRSTLERRGTVRPGTRSTGKAQPRTTRPGVTPGRTGTTTRPTTTRRPTTGRIGIPGATRGGATSGKRPTGSGTVLRPSRPTTGSGARPPTRVSPPARSGGSGRVIQVRPRGSGTSSGGAVRRPPPRSSGSSGAVRRVPTRSSGSSGAVRRPPARSSGSSGAVRRPPARSSSGGTVRRAPARPARSGSAQRSPPARARSSSGSARRQSPPRRSPPRRRAGGGGAASF